jgi:hypothetical protein
MGRFHGSGHLIVSRWRDGLIDQMGRVRKGKRRVIALVGFSSSAAPALSIRLRCGECRRMAFLDENQNWDNFRCLVI